MIEAQAAAAAAQLMEKANLAPGALVVVGCSTSEVLGESIGSFSAPQVGEVLAKTLFHEFTSRGIFVAAQCCEHLNRALITEAAALPFAQPVNVFPQPKAGGSFATALYGLLTHPIAVEHIRADAGLDIGGTLIGMHLKEVAVPLRLATSVIGSAHVTAARTRPKCIGGSRACYREDLL